MASRDRFAQSASNEHSFSLAPSADLRHSSYNLESDSSSPSTLSPPLLQGKPKHAGTASTLMHAHGYSNRVLGVAGVVGIVFMYSSSGPFGSGALVAAGGPLVALLSITLYPLVMSVPYGYIVAELCSAFPQDGGFAVWVLHAFGPFWGLQVGYWSWVSDVFSCAAMPDLTLRVFLYCFEYDLQSDIEEYALKLVIALVLTLPVVGGTRPTASVSLALVGLATLALSVFSIWSYAHTSASADFGQVRRDVVQIGTTETARADVVATGAVDIAWSDLVHTLGWKFGGLHMASLFAGEVKEPARVFPRAIGLTIALSFEMVFVPLSAALAAHVLAWPRFSESWTFLSIGREVGGTALFTIVATSELATTMGRYIATIYCTSFQISGMAEHDLLPPFLANKNNRFRTPQYAVLATFVVVLPLLLCSSRTLLRVGNMFSSAVELLVLLSAVWLRRSMPYIPRPVKMPGGMAVLLLATLCPAFVLCYALYDAFSSANRTVMVLIGLALGVLYGVFGVWRRRRAQWALSASQSSSQVVTPSS